MHSQRKTLFREETFFARAFRTVRTAPKEELEVIDVTLDRTCVTLQQAWKRMLVLGLSPEKIYQTPAYVEHVSETHPDAEGWGLIAIRRSNQGIAAILCVRKSIQEISFQLGHIRLFKKNLRALQVLGSLPLLHGTSNGLPGFAFKSLLQRYPDCRALVMQAVPVESIDQYRHLEGLSYHVLHGWRNCHVCSLPDSVDAYLHSLSAKKRYNLSRQVRLLARKAGDIHLVRITEPSQVPDLVEALRSLSSAQSHRDPDLHDQLASLAKNGLMLCYLLKCGNKTVALILGSQHEAVWHIHNIYYDEEYSTFSTGTSILHLAQQDVIEHLSIRRVDFGYGSPGQGYRSTHSLEKRGRVLVCPTFSFLNLMIKAYTEFEAINQTLCAAVKRIRKAYRQRRRDSENCHKKSVDTPCSGRQP